MNNFFNKWEPEIYVLMRVVIGFLFLWHGSLKLFDFPLGGPSTPMWVAVLGGCIQLVGGVLSMVGFATRFAAFLASGMMAVAYWAVYGANAFLPIVNGGEHAALYCFVFLFLAARGNGNWSVACFVDKRMSRSESLR